MIIQIRGTSGSGKSTVMRAVKDQLGEWNYALVEGRKQPLYYRTAGEPDIVLLGHYESPCGGCDTIGSARQVFELIQTFLDVHKSPIILCEGLLLSEDVKWSIQLKDNGLRVYYLTTPPEKCLEQIKHRREIAGNLKELNTENTLNRIAVIERSRLRLKEAGVECVRCSASQATGLILKHIGREGREE